MRKRLPKTAEEVLHITDQEARCGVALCVASCVTFGEARFYLDVRCLHSESHRGKFKLVAQDEQGAGLDVFFRSCVEIAPPAGAKPHRRWYETQYIVRFDGGPDTLFIDCLKPSSGRAFASMQVERSIWFERLVFDFYAKARNPFADGRYEEWLASSRATEEQLRAQRELQLDSAPLLSLVTPVYRTPPAFLQAMIDSVMAQTYKSWELIIVNASPDDEGVSSVLSRYDDERIRVIEHPENDGINGNTNCGIAACTGDYIGFIDHDDFIEPDLLFEYAKAIDEHGNPDLLYCDEDSYDENRGYMLALFKPDANLDLLYSNNYVVHLLMASRGLVERTERTGAAMNGAQDYDLTLQAFHSGGSIVHIARPLYHWRIHEQSTNVGNTDAKPYTNKTGATALIENFARRGVEAHVVETDVPFAYRSTFEAGCTRDDAAVVVDATFEGCLAARNRLARRSDREFVLFGSPATKVSRGEELETLLGYFERDEVGVVAPRLVNPDGLLAQTGLVLRRDGNVTYMGQGLPAEDGGYVGRFHRPCNYTAVSGDCCMMRRAEFLELGGYCEEFSTLLYASIDLCLRYRECGKLVVYTPFVTFEHAQRIVDLVGERVGEQTRAIERDRALLRERWPEVIGEADPLFNPNLDDSNPYFVL